MYEDNAKRKRLVILCAALALLFAAGLVLAYGARGAAIVPEALLAKATIEPTPSPAPSATPANTPSAATDSTPIPSADEDFDRTVIVIDGNAVGVVASREAADALIAEVMGHFEDMITDAGLPSTVIENELTLTPEAQYVGVHPSDTSYDVLYTLFTGENSPLRVVSTVTNSTVVTVPHETVTEKDKTLLVGTRLIVEPGSDGIERTESTAIYVNGVKPEENTVKTITVSEKRDALVLVGSVKLKTGSTPNKGQGEKGPDAGDIVFKDPAKGSITLNFGQYEGVLHLGLDYAVNEGEEILASANGTVVSVMERGGYGLTVEIDHGAGFVTRYAHLAASLVSLGDDVESGEAIAYAGASGNAEKPVLHFELRADGVAYNPRYYLD